MADVSMQTDQRRQKGGEPRRRGSASWGVKGNRLATDGKGQSRSERLSSYGYEQQVSTNAQTGSITSLRPSLGSADDGHHVSALTEGELEQGMPAEIVTGGRGHDDGENHECLGEKGIDSTILLNSNRTKTKDRGKET